MKDQYFGDINDYRKYGLLKLLAQFSGLQVGVCWMLTHKDSRTDGEFRSYLKKPNVWRSFDPQLYDAMCRLLQEGIDRSIHHARKWNLIPGSQYFESLLTDSAEARREYFTEAWERLAGCPLLFFDPDNGIEVTSSRWGSRGSAKYIYWRELKSAFSRDHSLVIYQHYPRVPRDRFVPFLAGRIAEEVGSPRVRAFKTPYVVFFLAEHPTHSQAFESVSEAVKKQWPQQITPWP